MSRREEKAAATRRRFLDATFNCLVEVGYHGTSTVAVCERAELARGTMLHHFPNKQALVLATEDLANFPPGLGHRNGALLGDWQLLVHQDHRR